MVTKLRTQPSVTSLLLFLVIILLALIAAAAALYGSQTVVRVDKRLSANDCRALYTGQITDTQTRLNKAATDIASAQFEGQVAGLVTNDDAELKRQVKLGRKAEKQRTDAQLDNNWANDEYQQLLQAQRHDHSKFHSLCDRGPTPRPVK